MHLFMASFINKPFRNGHALDKPINNQGFLPGGARRITGVPCKSDGPTVIEKQKKTLLRQGLLFFADQEWSLTYAAARTSILPSPPRATSAQAGRLQISHYRLMLPAKRRACSKGPACAAHAAPAANVQPMGHRACFRTGFCMTIA